MSSKRPSKLKTHSQSDLSDYIGSAGEVCVPDPNVDLSHVSIYHTASDSEHEQCPHCYHRSNQHKHVGKIHIQGLARDVMACESCSRLFDYVPDSIKAYVDEVKNACNTDNVTFTRAETKNDQNISTQNPQLEQKLDDLSETLASLVEDLTFKLEQQGNEINELKTDPLRRIKETINAFDLK